MKKNKLFSAMLAVIMLMNLIFIPQNAVALDNDVSWQEKIDEEVYESPIYENGKRLIY